MSTLADLIDFEAPPQTFFDNVGDMSRPCATLLWLGLAPTTRANYATAISSFESFCAERGYATWPAEEQTLGEWITTRAFGNTSPGEKQLKADTIVSYLSALRSVHVDRRIATEVFDSPWLERLIKGARRTFVQQRKDRFPITKDVLTRITSTIPHTVDDINCFTAFKVAWAGFLRLGEITYEQRDLASRSFADINVTRSDVYFSERDQHVVLRLKRTKTDTSHTGVEVILAATGEPTCPVQALRSLFAHDPQPPDAPLFRLAKTAFSYNKVVKILRNSLTSNGINDFGYSGHSFRRGAAQHASDNGMLEEHIQLLGRWTSQSFRLYFDASKTKLYTLNRQFQTGRRPAVTSHFE